KLVVSTGVARWPWSPSARTTRAGSCGLPPEDSALKERSVRLQRGQTQREGGPMTVGTEQEWQAARKELLAAERELEEHAQQVETQRRELPWVPVEKQYRFATEDGPKSLAELF